MGAYTNNASYTKKIRELLKENGIPMRMPSDEMFFQSMYHLPHRDRLWGIKVRKKDLARIRAMLAKEEVKYKGLARFPGSSRDLALVCDKSVLAGDVEKILRKCGGALLEKITLFDVYEGEQVGADKKSLAYSLLFRAPDRTLADTEVNEKIEKMLSALGEKGITLRA